MLTIQMIAAVQAVAIAAAAHFEGDASERHTRASKAADEYFASEDAKLLQIHETGLDTARKTYVDAYVNAIATDKRPPAPPAAPRVGAEPHDDQQGKPGGLPLSAPHGDPETPPPPATTKEGKGPGQSSHPPGKSHRPPAADDHGKGGSPGPSGGR